ncbi:class I SAM-dependent methyltransferase [Thiohalorhabdus methylotrophus]|uniref:Class I SAM-dependent methyltransferase n=1 Tax=Thiohalorhabdus methylotrophus TaxID=3242694 RepID=A0ABV4TYI8_9GAMM
MSQTTVESHYTRGDLESALFQALEAAGLDPAHLHPDDLAPVDEFHIRGAEATREMIHLAGFSAEDHVLDVGSGIGGPSRQLARQCGCRVTGLDLTSEYCALARTLAERVGLAKRVEYRQGDAQAMPFEDNAFDGVWTQHMSMNVADKDSLYGEIRRVLRPGGRLAMYEIVAGRGGTVHFPVPWARSPEISHLTTAENLEVDLRARGLEVRYWNDATSPAAAFFSAMLDRVRENGPPPLGLHILLGPDMREMAANMLRNLEEDRIRVVQVVMEG